MSAQATETDKPRLFKDYIDRASLERLGAAIRQVYPKFDADGFVAVLVADRFERLELKARIVQIAHRLRDFIPKDYPKTVDIFIKATPKVTGFENWALLTYVQLFGLDDLKTSVHAMQELTKHGSAEATIRPFILKYPDEMMTVLGRWAEDKNEHVRRLAAEGTRPLGVWIGHIPAFRKDPRPVLKILAKLRADDSLYVRKAVANNLNDISKDHPDLVLKTALAWMKANDPRTNWILKHACRSLIKKGHPEVFGLFGFCAKPQIEVRGLKIVPKRPEIGGEAVISFELVSKAKKPQKLAIDYKLHYLKANGKASPKVFKLAEKTIRPGETLALSAKHSFRQMSTRVHYPGKHVAEVVVNGTVCAALSFALQE